MSASNILICLAVIGVVTISTGLEPTRDSSSPVILRDAVNRIFSRLKLTTNKNSKLEEYWTIHEYFASVISRENQNRKEVTNLIRLDNIHNGTTNFTTAITEALNEKNTREAKSNAISKDGEVNKYIDNFLTTLGELKETFLVNNSYKSINSKILQHFNIPNANQNHSVYNEVDSNENATDEREFWEPTETRRVFKGQTTKIKHFPFVASVHIFNQFTCAGSIIKSDLVITAASCLQLAHNNRFYRENPAFLSVRVGSTFYNGGGENIPVMEVYFYPTYTPKTLRDNVAIMRLLRTLKFKKRYIKKIAIDESPTSLPLNTDGITIVGWGAKTISNKVHDPWKNRLSVDVLDLYPFHDCQEIYSKKYLTKKHFCAGFYSTGGGACNRDVGAPGLVRGILMGVVSFASPSCGAADAPTVFTKLGYYAKWIDEIIIESQNAPSYVARTTTWLPYTQTIFSTRSFDSRDFKIEPIGKKDVVIPYQHFDALRSDQKQVFQEFLETVFNSKEVQKYESKLTKFMREKKNEQEESIDNTDKSSKYLTRSGNNSKEISVEQIEPKAVTYMGNFDADDVAPYESNAEDSSSEEKIPQKYHDTKKVHRTSIDDHLDGQVDQLIKNLNLEKVISSELEDSDGNKVIAQYEKNNDTDDSILTLLFLSENERKAADLKKVNEGENQESVEDEGMSIDLGGGNDALKATNLTNGRRSMSIDEMYDILVDAINS